MRALLGAAGRAFLRAFGAAILTLSFGVLAAPNLDAAYLVGVAGLAAALAMGIRAVTAFIPELSFAHYFGSPTGTFVDAFIQGAVGSIAVVLPGLLDAPNLNFSRSVITALVVGAITAGLRAVQGSLTKTESPNPTGGLDPPSGARETSVY